MKRCQKCNRIFDDSWSVCLNCNNQVLISDESVVRAQFSTDDTFQDPTLKTIGKTASISGALCLISCCLTILMILFYAGMIGWMGSGRLNVGTTIFLAILYLGVLIASITASHKIKSLNNSFRRILMGTDIILFFVSIGVIWNVWLKQIPIVGFGFATLNTITCAYLWIPGLYAPRQICLLSQKDIKTRFV